VIAALFRRMDKARFLGFDVWEFSWRSLGCSYGRLFLRAVVLRHPLLTLAGARKYRRIVLPARQPDLSPVDVHSRGEFAGLPPEEAWVVGLGFCEKPMDPPCPAGRFNHRCRLLEQEQSAPAPEPCHECRIAHVAAQALAAGASVYIMTSAEDIARDLLLPSLRAGAYRTAVLSVCRYSLPPFTLAMAICGVRGWVFTYSSGDCRDFAAWSRADIGLKQERTFPSDEGRWRLVELLKEAAENRCAAGLQPARRFRWAGNLYVPDQDQAET